MLKLFVVILLALALSGCKRPTMSGTDEREYRPKPDELPGICPL